MIIIDSLWEDCYDLNTSDIWAFEREYFFKVKKDINREKEKIERLLPYPSYASK